MAALDPSTLERELEALRRQRYEASQRVRASRQPIGGSAIQARNAPGDPPSGPSRSAPGSGRFGSDRGFGGLPTSRSGDDPRMTGSLRDGPLSSRLGSGPSPRGPPGVGGGFQNGVARARFEGGHGSRGPRDYDDQSRDRDGGAAANAAAPPTRRRAVLSVVVSDRPAQNDEADDKAKAHELGSRDGTGGDRDWNRDPIRDHEADRDYGRDRRPSIREDRDRDRGWGRGGGGGDERDLHHQGEHGGSGGRGMKRPAPEAETPTGAGGVVLAEDPDSRKRARRLLGRALLGTLQKFRQEDAQFQASDAAARRAELARKAEEKAAAEAERLRRQAAEERLRKRRDELDALMDLNLATDVKVLELMYAKKLARRRALAAFLRADGVVAGAGGGTGTGRGPSQPQPVYWMPVSHCPVTLAVKQRQEKELEEWEEAVMAELAQEKEGLRMRAQARRQGIAERRQRAVDARGSGPVTEGTAAEERGAEEVEEDHEALEAVELDAHHEDMEDEELVHSGDLEPVVVAASTDPDGAGDDGTAAVQNPNQRRKAATTVHEVSGGLEADETAKDQDQERLTENAMEAETEAAAARDDLGNGTGDEVVA